MISCPECGKTFAHKTSMSGHMRRCTVTSEQLFWSKVDKSGGPDACWEWQGYRQRQGYGWVCVQGRYYLAHRLAYEYVMGGVPDGLFVLHKCDNYPCVNPSHMFLGDHDANCADKVAKGRLAWGEKAKRNKLVAKDVLAIRQLQGKADPKTLAEKYGVQAAHIQRIWNRSMWARLPDAMRQSAPLESK